MSLLPTSIAISIFLITTVLLYFPSIITASEGIQQQLKLQNIDTNSTMAARTVAKIVTARQQAEGVGATVRRSIGVINQRNFNPFLMLDHFRVLVKMGSLSIPIEGKKLSH